MILCYDCFQIGCDSPLWFLKKIRVETTIGYLHRPESIAIPRIFIRIIFSRMVREWRKSRTLKSIRPRVIFQTRWFVMCDLNDDGQTRAERASFEFQMQDSRVCVIAYSSKTGSFFMVSGQERFSTVISLTNSNTQTAILWKYRLRKFAGFPSAPNAGTRDGDITKTTVVEKKKKSSDGKTDDTLLRRTRISFLLRNDYYGLSARYSCGRKNVFFFFSYKKNTIGVLNAVRQKFRMTYTEREREKKMYGYFACGVGRCRFVLDQRFGRCGSILWSL